MATKKDLIVTDETPATPLEEVAEYEILENFKGSPDGRFVIEYQAGEVAELTASLAEVALAEGWAKAK